MTAPILRLLLPALVAGVVLCLAGSARAQEIALDEFSIEAEGVEGGAAESEVTSEVREILSQPDYRRMRVQKVEQKEYDLPQWTWPKWLRDFFRWLGRFFAPLARFFQGLGDGLTIGAWVILFAIVAVIVYLVLRVLAAYQARWSGKTATTIKKTVEEGEAGLNPGDVSADVYLARANEFAARGEYREAIGCLLMGAMSHAERAAWVRPRRGLTHRDYLRSMRGKEQPYNGFKTILGIYEPICFGKRDAFREHFDISLDSYRLGFSSLSMKA